MFIFSMMIHNNLLLILSLLFVVSMLVMIGQKLRISYPIFLVIGGLLISLIPHVPDIEIDPQLIFLIFLPPLLYEAAWFTSWHEFWKYKRPISLLAFGLVIFTSCVVAYFTHAFIPGFTLALGFLLGGIISPPDAVAATSVLKGLNIPKRALTILEGESLVNDASSLIVFRFALATIITGQFVLQRAVVDFFMLTAMGIIVGVAIALVFYLIHKFLPTTPNIDTALTLIAPYMMYITAEQFHYSGVMAVVSGGLFLSYRSHEIFNHQTRIQANNVWSTLIFLLNGLVFILIGLELPVIVEGHSNYFIAQAVFYGILISLLTIVIRIIWVYPATFIPRWISKKIRTNERNPGWRGPFLVSWAGMRGVVSLASALSIPLTLSIGQAFPQRNLILFITFIVILVTLVFQGLTLPMVIRFLKIQEIDTQSTEEEHATHIRLQLMKVALKRLEEKFAREILENELVSNLKLQLQSDVTLTTQKMESLECDFTEREEHTAVLLDLIQTQRKELTTLRKSNAFSDEILRKQEAQLDLDEARVMQRI